MTDVLISAGELADLVSREPCVIVDTRNPDAYGAGHIPNAVNVHEIFTYLATSTPEGPTYTYSATRETRTVPEQPCN